MTSPFLAPGVQFAWDSTSLGWLKECPQKYKYFMIDQLQTKGYDVSPHLFFGSVYQKCLETFDRLRASGSDHEDALAEVIHLALKLTWFDAVETEDFSRPAGPWESTDVNKTRFTLVRSVLWHIEEYRDHPTKTLILASGDPAVELNFKIEVGNELVLCGHLDRVVEWDGDRYVLDHKTTKSAIQSHYFMGYRPENQMSLYTLAGGIIFNSPIKGVMIDAAQILVTFTRFARGFTNRTQEELDEWLNDTHFWVQQAWRYAETGHYPKNDKSCHDYGGCTFRDICGAAPKIRETLLKGGFEKRPEEWNPLVPRKA